MARREKEQIDTDDWALGADDSLLIRSAESLGRVIGSLQRELDNATKRLFKADGAVSGDGDGNGASASKRAKKTVPTRKRAVRAATAKKTASAVSSRGAKKKSTARKAAAHSTRKAAAKK